MFKNYSDCTKCVHNSVCQYKEQLIEAYDKIGTKWANICVPDIFKLDLECTEFKADETISWFK